VDLALLGLKISWLKKGRYQLNQLFVNSVTIGSKSTASLIDICNINGYQLYQIEEFLKSVNGSVIIADLVRDFKVGYNRRITCIKIGPLTDYSRRSTYLWVPVLDCKFSDGKIKDEI